MQAHLMTGNIVLDHVDSARENLTLLVINKGKKGRPMAAKRAKAAPALLANYKYQPGRCHQIPLKPPSCLRLT